MFLSLHSVCLTVKFVAVITGKSDYIFTTIQIDMYILRGNTECIKFELANPTTHTQTCYFFKALLRHQDTAQRI